MGDKNQNAGTTERFAAFVCQTNYDDIPEEAIETGKLNILDGLGVTLAGACEPASRVITNYVRKAGGITEASVIASGFKTAAPMAALANGTMMHVLDYDDIVGARPGFGSIGHPTAPLLPAVLAMVEASHTSGRVALTAYVLGFEVEGKLGVGMGPEHYAVGWHATATIGVMAAAAASAKILRFDVEQTRMALGIAATHASGLKQNFGTMTKSLQVGNAARSGVLAAVLINEGFAADRNILEGSQGFFRALGRKETYDFDGMAGTLGNPFSILSPGVNRKFHPCGGGLGRAIDAMLYLVEEHNIAADQVTEIECTVEGRFARLPFFLRPSTHLEAKFSLPYCLVMALLDRKVGIKQFDEANVTAPRVRQFLGKVRFSHPIEGEIGKEYIPARVTVTLTNGTRFSHEVPYAKGNKLNPLTQEEVVSKFRDCAQLVLSQEQIERCIDLVLNLEKVADTSELMDLVSSSRNP